MSLSDVARSFGFEGRRQPRRAFATARPRPADTRQRLPKLSERERWLLGPSATRLFWTVALVVTLIAAGIVAAFTYTYQKNLIRAQAETTSDQFSSSLMGFLDKFRLMPPVLARSAEVLDFYAGRLDQESAHRLLNATRGMSGARQIRFLNIKGAPIAASDGYGDVENLPNEAHKIYFQMALQGRLGRGHSTVGAERLYHFAAPIRLDNEVIGVVVLDASLALVEQAWALSRDPIFITDQSGIVFMGNRQLLPPSRPISSPSPPLRLRRAPICMKAMPSMSWNGGCMCWPTCRAHAPWPSISAS
jgi:two-component system C4-dicarboxylate transport sensor histidine kinase DctB